MEEEKIDPEKFVPEEVLGLDVTPSNKPLFIPERNVVVIAPDSIAGLNSAIAMATQRMATLVVYHDGDLKSAAKGSTSKLIQELTDLLGAKKEKKFKITIQDRGDDIVRPILTRRELESHAFQKYIDKGKKRKF